MSILLLTLLSGAIRTIGTAININGTNISNKRKAIKEGKDIYMDHNHIMHHVENDQPFKYWNNYETHEVWEINPYNHEFIRNVTAENKERKCEENKLKAKREGREFYPCEFYGKDHIEEHTKIGGVVGYRFKRVGDDNEVYVKRKGLGKFPNMIWYMNVRTKAFQYYDTKEARYGWYSMDDNKHHSLDEITEDDIIEEMNRLNDIQRKIKRTGMDEFGFHVRPDYINRNINSIKHEYYDNGEFDYEHI